MKKAKPVKQIARARALFRDYVKIDRELDALYRKQDQLHSKRRLAGIRYSMYKQYVDGIMFKRGLGSAKLPKSGWY